MLSLNYNTFTWINLLALHELCKQSSDTNSGRRYILCLWKIRHTQTDILFCGGVNVNTLLLSFCNVTKIKTVDWNSFTSKQGYKCHVIFYYSGFLLFGGELSPRWTVATVNCRRGELSPRWKDARGELSTAMNRPVTNLRETINYLKSRAL